MHSLRRRIRSTYTRIVTRIGRLANPSRHDEEPDVGNNQTFIMNNLRDKPTFVLPATSTKFPLELNFSNTIIFTSLDDLHKLTATNTSKHYVAIKITYDSRYLVLSGKVACLVPGQTLEFRVMPKKSKQNPVKDMQEVFMVIKTCFINETLIAEGLMKFWDEIDRAENYRNNQYSLNFFEVTCVIFRNHKCCSLQFLEAARREESVQSTDQPTAHSTQRPKKKILSKSKSF